MKTIWAICSFELKRLLDDRKRLFIVLAAPILLAYFFGSIASHGSVQVPVGFVDNDHSISSKELITRVSTDPLIQLQELTQAQADEAVKDEKVIGYFVIPKGMEQQLFDGKKAAVQFQTDANRVSGASFTQTINDALATLAIDAHAANILKQHDPSLSFPQAYNAVLKQSIPKTTIHAVAADKNAQTDSLDSMNRLSMGFAMMFIMYSMMSVTGVFLYARQHGIWYRTMTMPVKKAHLLLGYLFSFFIMGWLQMGVVMLITRYGFGVKWGHPLSAFALVSALLLSVIGIGLFLAGYVKTLQQQSALSTVFVLSSCMLGGVFWPIEIVPNFMQTIAHFVPQYWALEGFTTLVGHGGGLADIMLPLSILLGSAALFIVLGLRKIRFNI